MKRNEVRIRITYEIVTYESAEHGDAEERGWIDQEGETYTVREAVKFLESEGISEGSCSPIYPSDVGHCWLIGNERENYRTGAQTTRSYHIDGDPRAKCAIYSALGLLRSES
jgi:hypothetical protein